MALLDSKGIPAGIVNTLDRVVADPQVRHRNLVVEMRGDKGKVARVIGNPVLFEEAEKVAIRYPPEAGENSIEVLKELLDLTDEDVAAAVNSGAVSTNRK